MTIEESVIQKLKGLPSERQREVLNFVEFLEIRSGGGAGPDALSQ